jgi:hypothetical protein
MNEIQKDWIRCKLSSAKTTLTINNAQKQMLEMLVSHQRI